MEEVLSFCDELLKRLQMDLTVAGRVEDGVIYINITGNDRSYLLSNAAALLNGIEYLLNKTFPGDREEAPGIEVDSDDYRRHRELELRLLAEMGAKKVLTTRKALTLQPMAPRERRIVHLALGETAGIESRSSGTGDERSITIYPLEALG